MKKKFILHLKAIDFRGTSYDNHRNCAITKAVKRQLNVEHAKEGVNVCTIEENDYYHVTYDCETFEKDAIIASKSDDDKIIRKIEFEREELSKWW